MSDKEPRRRNKKRKDLQTLRKEDVHSEDVLFTKSDGKDSDQEIEDDIVMSVGHQPSGVAKIVFMLIFSGLIVSMSFVFISLHGSGKGDLSLFEDHHEEPEQNDIAHDENQVESTENFLHGFNDQLLKEPDSSYSSRTADSSSEPLSEDSKHTDQNSIEDKEEDDDDTEALESAFVESFVTQATEAISRILGSTQKPSSEDEDNISDSLENDVSEPVDIEKETEQYINEFVHQTTESFIQEESPPEITTQAISDFTTLDPTKSPDPIEDKIELEDSNPVDPVHFIVSDSVDQADFSVGSDQVDQPDFTTPFPGSTVDPEDELENDVIEAAQPDEIENPREHHQHSFDEDDLDDESTFTEAISVIAEEFQKTYYEKEDITNEEDFKFRAELDDLDSIIEKSPEKALQKTEELLKVHENSPRLHYARAHALDKWAEAQRSNKHLEEAIAAYQKVLSLEKVPEQLYLLCGKRAADRMRFRGFMGKSVKLLMDMSNKFPQNVELKNLVSVGYLLIGQNKEAKRLLYEVLKSHPESGFAKVHLGFILKTDDANYEEAIPLMREGITSKESGVVDGRFYFHLGDALHRIGKQEQALQVYEEAVKEGLFLSTYQRSLYNVNGLTGKPWWDPYTTKYTPDFKIMEKNWKVIRDEALSLTNDKNSGFLPETEGLQDKGDWKQFELFARGRKLDKNCLKAPKTCALISQMPDAASCKRGQAKFSIIRPSTHVWAHTGPTNCRLRAHLGLVVPEGARIRVAHETRVWEEGKVLLFDDSFEHEVWHDGNSSRLVLIVDFWHPELSTYQKRSLTPI